MFKGGFRRSKIYSKRFYLFCSVFLITLLVACLSSLQLLDIAAVETDILIDQFGYRPQDHKVAVIKLELEDTPNPEELRQSFDVRDVKTGEVVYSGSAALWNQGQVHSQSGDVAQWFDFSKVTQPGEYTIVSSTGKKSFPFEISEDVYRKVLVAATRMYFYQRSGYAKKPPFADARWQDEAAFLGPQQDTEARYVNDKENVALARDMHGGWFDAGDTNKYVTFAVAPIHQLLSAYSQNPAVWTDDFNIPESGNNIPDLLDEIRVETDWLERMQDEDGGVFIKLGTLDYSSHERPSLDLRPRFYGPKCSSSTIAAASMYAHAALVFDDFPELAEYAENLKSRASKAWNWFKAHPIETDCDTQEIKSGDADTPANEQTANAVVAAVYLFALTGNEQYTDYIQENINSTIPFSEDVWARYGAHQGDALLFYSQLPNARLEVRDRILDRARFLVQTNVNAYGDSSQLDPYRAYMPDDQYHWGSNAVKANYGNTNYDVVFYQLTSDDLKDYETRALDTLHYFHGVNPLSLVYLTNMYEYGADYSANEMWHEWFGQGIYKNALSSPMGPAPGYLTGGPNKQYTGSAPIKDKPPMKVYLDSNKLEFSMWEITEPSIGYQSAYVKLLSKFLEN
ncbi:MAG: glycoside hydrolase family 9 protein [Coleofasciculus sp. Co-bin14]|nr:glycoside hydrolase family 9 protein [Coleofasciculus sp. Co-bin14]